MAKPNKPDLKAVPGGRTRTPANLKPSREELLAELEESNFEIIETYDLLVLSNNLQAKTNAYVKGVEDTWANVVDNRTRVKANLEEGARYISKHEFYKNKKLSTPTANIHTLEVGTGLGSEIEEATNALPTPKLEEGE